jgi:polyphosphate kinase
MRYFLHQFDYDDKDTDVVYAPDSLLVQRGLNSFD